MYMSVGYWLAGAALTYICCWCMKYCTSRGAVELLAINAGNVGKKGSIRIIKRQGSSSYLTLTKQFDGPICFGFGRCHRKQRKVFTSSVFDSIGGMSSSTPASSSTRPARSNGTLRQVPPSRIFIYKYPALQIDCEANRQQRILPKLSAVSQVRCGTFISTPNPGIRRTVHFCRYAHD